MRQTRLTLLIALLFAALTLASTACKSEGDEGGEEKTEEEGGEGGGGEASEVEQKLAVPEVGAAAAPASDITAPGAIGIEKAIAGMGNGAKNRIVVRTKPLAASGLIDMAMGVVPPDAKAEYDEFVSKTGFDPIKQFGGMLVYADGDMEKFETAEPTIVVGIEGAIDEKLLTYLDERDDDDDDDKDDDDEVFTMILLADLPDGVRAKFVELIKKPEEGEEPKQVETLETGGGTVIAEIEGEMVKYGFLWSGGMIIGSAPAGGKPAIEAADAPIKKLLGELKAAEAATAEASAKALEGRIVGNGIPVAFAIGVDANLTIDVTAKLPAAMKKQAEQFMAGVPKIKENPDMVLADAPPFVKDLGKLFIEGTNVSMDGDVLVGHSQVEMEALKAALQPVLDAVK